MRGLVILESKLTLWLSTDSQKARGRIYSSSSLTSHAGTESLRPSSQSQARLWLSRWGALFPCLPLTAPQRDALLPQLCDSLGGMDR